jgi:hemolysin D
MSGEALGQSVTQIEICTRYGLLHGHVVDVSRAPLTEEQRKQDNGGRQPPDDKNGQRESGLQTYVARVGLGIAGLTIDGGERSLGPGIAVTVEIKTGPGRTIKYLPPPLQHSGMEFLRSDDVTE